MSGSSLGAQPTAIAHPPLEDPANHPTGPRPTSKTAKECATCGGRYPEDFNVCPRDATPLVLVNDEDNDDPIVGTVLADMYRVVRVIGEGGMGRVYEVHHTRLSHRRFALKAMHAEYARYPDVVKRFQREAEAASRIAHPNVIEVYDVGRTPQGCPYLVGEFLDGDDLGVVAHKVGRFSVGKSVFLMRQVCRALGKAHALHVVHRDIKPENLFLVGDPVFPRIKVLDFGISKIDGQEGAHLTRTGVIMGTPAYMAPEQARGDKVDHRADIYAVGAILYRLLTGRTPFATDDANSAITAVLTEMPPRPRSITPEIPEAIELIIERAMAKNPAERFQTMEQLDDALAPFDLPYRTAIEPLGPPSSTGAHGHPPSSHLRSAPAPGDELFSAASLPPPSFVVRTNQEARRARPAIVVMSLLATVSFVLAVSDGLASAILLITHQSSLSQLNAVLLTVGVFAALLTPLALYLRHVVKSIWGTTVRAVRLARALRRAFLTALCTYAVLTILVRFFETIINQNPQGAGWPGWSVVTAGTSLLTTFSALVLFQLRGSRE